MKKLFAITSLALLTSTAFAAEAGKTDTGLDYNELSVSYVSMEAESGTFAGYSLNATYLLTENFFIGGIYSSVEKSPYTLASTQGLIGYRLPIAATVDGYATVGYGLTTVTSSKDEQMYPLALGIRASVTPEIDLRASVNYTEATEAQTGFSAGVKYKLNDNIFLNAAYMYSKGDTATTHYTLGIGIKF
jgi:opacity protein-like surface antigen